MKKDFSIEIGDVVDAMTTSQDDTMSAFLDLETGEVVFASEDGDDADFFAEVQDSDRYLPIERVETRRQYEWRVEFASTVEESDIAESLQDALSGKGAFGRFRSVIGRFPDVQDRWLAFEQERVKALCERALQDAGVVASFKLPIRKPTNVSETSSPPRAVRSPANQIGLYDLLLLGAPDGKTELLGGQVHRRVVVGSPSEARAVFKRVARELCEREGIGWRNRFIDGKSTYDLDRFHLVLTNDGVELRVDVSPECWTLWRTNMH